MFSSTEFAGILLAGFLGFAYLSHNEKDWDRPFSPLRVSCLAVLSAIFVYSVYFADAVLARYSLMLALIFLGISLGIAAKVKLKKPLNQNCLDCYSGAFISLFGIIGAASIVSYQGYSCIASDVPVIDQVQVGGPAALAGIKPGDHLIEVNGKKFETWALSVSNLGALPQDKTLSVRVKTPGHEPRVATLMVSNLGGRLHDILGVEPLGLTHDVGLIGIAAQVSGLILHFSKLGVSTTLGIRYSSMFWTSATLTDFQKQCLYSLSIVWLCGLMSLARGLLLFASAYLACLGPVLAGSKVRAR